MQSNEEISILVLYTGGTIGMMKDPKTGALVPFDFDNIYAHLGLMTHFGRADYLCFGLGYRFNQKYYLNHEKGTRHHPPGLH